METIINGLLVQKAGSPKLEPGDERWFSWEERVGKTGKSYIKIKNESKEYGGRLCAIIDAEKTDFTDKFGNVSYNVGFQLVEDKDNVQSADATSVDETKRHLIQAANLYNLCADTVNAVIEPNIKGMTAELYQSALASLFIEASRSGLISKMPTSKLK